MRVDALTKWSDPQCVFAQRFSETYTETDRDDLNERSNRERTDRVVERLAPETFAPFIVPFRGEKEGEKEKESKLETKKADDAEIVTQANPFAVPDAYVAALDAKVRAVASLRGALRDARLDEHTKRELQATIQAHFKEWLLASGSMRQVYELARIERGESAL